MQDKERSQRRQSGNDEEWQGGHPGRVPDLRDKDVQDRDEIRRAPQPNRRPSKGWESVGGSQPLLLRYDLALPLNQGHFSKQLLVSRFGSKELRKPCSKERENQILRVLAGIKPIAFISHSTEDECIARKHEWLLKKATPHIRSY